MKKLFVIIFISSVLLHADILVEQSSTWDFNKEGYQIIDVRTPKEWKSGVVKGVYKIYFLDDEWKINPNFVKEVEQIWDKKSKIVLLCRSGSRADKAARLLEDAGFEADIINLEGGMNRINRSVVEIE